MKHTPILIAIAFFLATGRDTIAGDNKDSRESVHGVAQRLTALEALVEKQARQIDLLQKALRNEIHARMTNDAFLRIQLTNTPKSEFSPVEIATLQGVAAITSVVQSNVHIAGSVSVAGDVTVTHGNSLFVGRIQPSDSGLGGNYARITVIDGNLGIQGTNTLFVNAIRAFQEIPPSTEEWENNGFRYQGSVLWGGPLLFRTWTEPDE